MAMRPLVFLTVRTLINGVKRAVTSPRRLIGMSVLLFYWFRFLTPAFQGGRRGEVPAMTGMPMATMPSVEVIDAVVFGLFAVLSLFLMIGSFAPRGGFRPADVDVLFPTPVNPKAVLAFRIVRDALVTLLMPLFFAVLARPMTFPFQAFVRNFPAQGQLLGKAATVAWLLLALAWTTLGYALSMFVNRSDERSDRNKKIIDGALFGLMLAVALFIGLRLRNELSWQTVQDLAHHPFLRIVFFTASMATAAVMAVFTGQPLFAVLGIGGLLLVIAGSFAMALTQVGFMYDQAAAKGFDAVNLRNLQRSGDTYAIVADQARKGKVRNGRLTRWLGRFQVRGGTALLWKELLLQARGAMWQYAVFTPLVLILVVLPVWGSAKSGSLEAERFLLLTFLGLSVLTLSLQTSTGGFIEFLRRVDFLKPLPFGSTVTVFWEVVPKAVPTTLICGLACLGVVAVDPRLWDIALGGIFMAPSLSIVLTSVALLVTVLFPDVEDATQRSFRGLMMMLGCAIAASPMLALVGVLVYFKVNGLVVALPAVALNLAVAMGVSTLAGGLYAGYNPSE
jgi:hypothetical protein